METEDDLTAIPLIPTAMPLKVRDEVVYKGHLVGPDATSRWRCDHFHRDHTDGVFCARVQLLRLRTIIIDDRP